MTTCCIVSPGFPKAVILLQCPHCSGFLVSQAFHPRLSPSVSAIVFAFRNGFLSQTSRIIIIPTGWLVGSHFPRGLGSVATSLFPWRLWVRSGLATLPCTWTLILFFFQMAGALRGRIGIISQLLLDLGMNPTPDHPVSVEIRCDCLAVIPRNQALPLSVTTGFCLLSTHGARAKGGRVRLINWCNAQGFSLTFGCPLFGLLENGEVFLRAPCPPEPGMEE